MFKRLHDPAWLASAIARGCSPAQIARSIGCTKRSVLKQLRLNGAGVRCKLAYNLCRDRAWFTARRHEKMSVSDIARAAGVSTRTAGAWLHRHGLPVFTEKRPPKIKPKSYFCHDCKCVDPAKFSSTNRSRCKQCRKASAHSYKHDRKGLIVARLGGKCSCCGWNSWHTGLQVHHRDPKTKDRAVSRQLRRAPIAKLLKELEKCVLLCANCHAGVHSGHVTLATGPAG